MLKLDPLIKRLLRGQSPKEWLIEFIQFCVVGLGAYIVDVGLFNLLAHADIVHLPGDPSLTSKIISVTVSVIFSWIVNRLWTFRKNTNENKVREFVLFVAANIGGMIIALACLVVSRYGLNLRSRLADNISANIIGLVLGTAFRYIIYRYVIFAAKPNPSTAPADKTVAGTKENTSANNVTY